jgi:oxygen-independent coproporphyrinogen-3 oxidase
MHTSSCDDVRARLIRLLRECAYPGYVYGYPHKKAYRTLPRSISLAQAWEGEDLRHLFAYVHIPFCSQRCSFCNLFTYVPPNGSPVGGYLDALAREMEAYARALSSCRFTRLYIGGGTPTYLDLEELTRLLGLLRTLGIHPAATKGCIEASPETIDQEKVGLLREAGFQRISLGVQSLVEEELREVNRRFDFELHAQAIGWIGEAGFPHFNIDLIYGLPGQTESSWRYSLEGAIDSPASSLFLYPLYVRPLTGLAGRGRLSLDGSGPTTRQMAAMYDHAVERLSRAGFRQLTMRQFRRDAMTDESDSEYRCQEHGLVGLGAGARSYTANLHYSTPWKMIARNIRGVIEEYQRRMTARDTTISYGFVLNEDERRRRFVIQSLLFDGLNTMAFERDFGIAPHGVESEVWEALAEEGCVEEVGGCLRFTGRGRRHADIVGQLFFSPRVRELIESYEYDT